MSENKETGEKKTLGLSRPGQLELRKTIESAQVGQSFAHGRSKTVQIEVKKRRTFKRGTSGSMTEVTEPARTKPRTGDAAEGAAEAIAQAGALTGQERAARARAHESARLIEEEAARRREIEVEQRAEEEKRRPAEKKRCEVQRRNEDATERLGKEATVADAPSEARRAMAVCFVIQPFDRGKFDKRYEDVIAPAVRAIGLKPYRVDRDPSVSIPINDIRVGTQSDPEGDDDDDGDC